MQAIKLRPSWGKAHSRRGAALAALDQVPEAIEAFERGLELDPDSAFMQACCSAAQMSMGYLYRGACYR